MILVAYPQANSKGELHIWVGVLGIAQPPQPTFNINSSPAQSSGTLSAIHDGNVDAQQRHLDHSGVFVLNQPPSGMCQVDVYAGGQSVSLRTAALPDDIPAILDGEFKVLLCSCYSQPQDAAGLEDIIVTKLGLKPDLTIMAGDQVYLDLPVNLLERTSDELTADMRGRYLTNWTSMAYERRGIIEVMQLAPVVNIPDDHEYWNNYPFEQTIIPNTRTQAGRNHWTQVAKELFRGFQQCASTKNGATRIDVGPLKFLCVDLRSDRDGFTENVQGNVCKNLMPSATFNEFKIWCIDLTGTPGSIGVLCSGQALFSTKSDGNFKMGDAEMPNYEQFNNVTAEIDKLAAQGIPVLYMTGDVHWGRVASATYNDTGRQMIFEVISSPSTLIRFPGKDEWKKVKAGLKGIFGSKDPWPLHDEAGEVPDRFGPDGRFRPATLVKSVVGNQVAILGFSLSGTAVRVSVTYYGISSDPELSAPRRVEPFYLRRY